MQEGATEPISLRDAPARFLTADWDKLGRTIRIARAALHVLSNPDPPAITYLSPPSDRKSASHHPAIAGRRRQALLGGNYRRTQTDCATAKLIGPASRQRRPTPGNPHRNMERARDPFREQPDYEQMGHIPSCHDSDSRSGSGRSARTARRVADSAPLRTRHGN